MRIHRLATNIVLGAVVFAGGVLPAAAGSAGAVRGVQMLVTEVYDGDTVVVGIDGHATEVRLIGVDTPETVHPDKPVQFFGPEASAYTRRMLKGKRVGLEFDAPDRPGGAIDAYGRTLAYVITPDGKNFNLELVRLGYGRAYTRFPFKYKKEFKAAEREARLKGLGIWSRSNEAALADPDARGRIIGNIRSRVYHLPGEQGYLKVSKKNRVYFESEEEAHKAGFRKAGE